MPPSPVRLPAAAPSFRVALLGWYRREARVLPWRQTPSLYRTVVSEFMLQQTQVSTVLPYFERWMRAFPDFPALATAPATAALRLWEGLGYYSRAQNLHRLAQAIAGRPAPPRTPEAWQDLPGVGPYTAAAVTSIAFGYPAACVDGNVVRILTRLTADRTRYPDGASAAKRLAPLARQLLSQEEPGDHNQAMMELGATLCTRRNPQCPRCPVAAFCEAGRGSDPAQYPRLAPKSVEARSVVRVWCARTDALLLHRAPADARRLAGIYELPTARQAGLSAAAVGRERLLAARSRAITRYRIAESIHAVPPASLAARVARARPAAADAGGLVWVAFDQLELITLSGPHRRWLGEIQRKLRAAP